MQLRLADDVKYSDDADQPAHGSHEVDIGGNLDEATEIWIEPAEPSDGAVTEVSDTDRAEHRDGRCQLRRRRLIQRSGRAPWAYRSAGAGVADSCVPKPGISVDC